MSCHDIGRGMNEVVRKTITLYDDGEIGLNAANKIISTCSVAVNWCDGNSYEAVDYIRKCRCGSCLKLIPKGERLYSIYDVYHRDICDLEKQYELACDGLCEECFTSIFDVFFKEEGGADHFRQQIIDNFKDREKEYLSDGKMSDNNNGCQWVR